MQLIIDNLTGDNFKGCQHIEIEFAKRTDISGANATGKTTILDMVWWLLFGKDSQGKEKFEIRTLDENGEKIHNTDIVVEAAFHTDDREFVLKKTQRERWVTKRGTVTAELQGNDNIYEIDGFEKKESDYKEFIRSLVDENTFKILSNPVYFSTLPWKEQREMLMQLVSIPSDYELGMENPTMFAPILDDLGKASTDEMMSKYRKEQAGVRDKQNAVPIRIDEASKRKQPVNVELLTKQRKALEGEVAEIEKYFSSTDTTQQARAIAEEIAALKLKQTELLRKSREDYETRKSEVKMALIKAQADANILSTKVAEYTRSIKRDEEFLESNIRIRDDLKAEWEKVKDREYDGGTECFNCGRQLPDEMLDRQIVEFEKRKERDLTNILEKGRLINNEIERLETNIENARRNLEESSKKYEEAQADVAKLQTQLNEITAPEIPSECYEIDDQIAAKEKIAESLVQTDTSDYQVAKESLLSRIHDIDEELMQVKINEEADARIAELRKEQTDLAQQAALIEKQINTLSAFVICKMDMISDNLNGKFKNVQFRLFRKLINGGIEPCCEATYDGVPYASLNSGHRILAGIEIIKAMQKATGVKTPVIIDNAESLSSFNLPIMDCQLITLTVSDNRNLTVNY